MSPKAKSKKKRIGLKIALALVVILVAFRIYLPYLVLDIVNKKLTEIKDYNGHVQDIDIRLLIGSYRLKNIELNKTSGKIPVPFFSANVIDFSVEWKALFDGAIVGEIEAFKPVLNFVKGPTEATSQTHVDKHWQDVVDDLMPLKINRFEINDGEIHYRDFHSSPKINVAMDQVHILAENLSNSEDKKELLPSRATASAFIYKGMMTVNMKLDALNKTPTFDMDAELKNLDITSLNDFLRAYGKFDASKGNISLYTEAAAKDGKIKGYMKPLIKDLKVVNWKEDKQNLGKLIWESIVELGGWVFKNHPKDQLGTQVEFEGNLKKPDIAIWSIIGELLRNAFIQALHPALENSISIKTPIKKEEEKRGFLKSLFKGKKKDK